MSDSVELGQPLSINEKRKCCAKCGKTLFIPVSVHNASAGYCGNCKFLLHLINGAFVNAETRTSMGLPRRSDYRDRLDAEHEPYYIKKVEQWYEVDMKPSKAWAARLAAFEKSFLASTNATDIR